MIFYRLGNGGSQFSSLAMSPDEFLLPPDEFLSPPDEFLSPPDGSEDFTRFRRLGDSDSGPMVKSKNSAKTMSKSHLPH